MIDTILDALAWVIPVVLAVTMHEAAHGWMAERFGDNTARLRGRVTFNPLKHIDRFGTIILPGLLLLAHAPFLFGYAKPVPVNFKRLEPPRKGMILVALAGPGINIALAILFGLLLHIESFITPEQAPWLFLNIYRSLMMNAVLATFNLLPILPLDGGRVVAALLGGKPRKLYDRTERLGMLAILLLLLVLPMMGLDVAHTLITKPAMWLLEQVLFITGNES